MSSTDWLDVRLRLLGGRQFQTETAAAAAGIHVVGDQTALMAKKTELARIETFAWRQGLYTLRRELFATGLAITGVGVGVLKLGFDFNESKEKGVAAFTGILGSVRAARSEVGQLIDLTHLTGFSLSQLSDPATRLLDFGFSVREVNADLRAFGLFAQKRNLGIGGLDSLVNVFARIHDQGQLSGRTLLMLMRTGVPALKILREQLHLTDLQISQIRAGTLTVPAALALPALVKGIGATPGTIGLSGLAGIGRSWAGELAAEIDQPLFDWSTRELPRFNALMKRAVGGFRSGGFTGMFAGIDPSGRLVSGWTALVSVMKAGWQILGAVFRIAQPFIPLLALFAGGISDLTHHQTLLKLVLAAVAGWWVVTRTRMLAVFLLTKGMTIYYGLLGRATVAYGLVLRLLGVEAGATTGEMIALDAAMSINPVLLLIEAVAGLGFAFIALGGNIRGTFNWLGRFFGILDSHNHFSWSHFFGIPTGPVSWGSIGNFFKPPGLAVGGTTTSAGSVMVGENGPEILRLPRAASVIPLERAQLAGGIKLPPIEVANVDMDGRKVAEITFRWQQTMEAIA